MKRRRWLPRVGDVGVCDGCGTLGLLYRLPNGLVWFLDPDRFQRRWLASLVGPAAVLRHGFGPGSGTPHVCQCAQAPPRAKSYENLSGGGPLRN